MRVTQKYKGSSSLILWLFHQFSVNRQKKIAIPLKFIGIAIVCLENIYYLYTSTQKVSNQFQTV